MTDQEFDQLIEESMRRQKFASGGYRTKVHVENGRETVYLDECMFSIKPNAMSGKHTYSGRFDPRWDDDYERWPGLSCPA